MEKGLLTRSMAEWGRAAQSPLNQRAGLCGAGQDKAERGWAVQSTHLESGAGWGGVG